MRFLLTLKQTSSGANHASTAISRQLESLSALAIATESMSTTEQRVANTAQDAAEAIQNTDGVALEGQKIVSENNRYYCTFIGANYDCGDCCQ